MITHEKEFNFGDQNAFKLGMMERGVIVICRTMIELMNELKFDENIENCFI